MPLLEISVDVLALLEHQRLGRIDRGAGLEADAAGLDDHQALGECRRGRDNAASEQCPRQSSHRVPPWAVLSGASTSPIRVKPAQLKGWAVAFCAISASCACLSDLGEIAAPSEDAGHQFRGGCRGHGPVAGQHRARAGREEGIRQPLQRPAAKARAAGRRRVAGGEHDQVGVELERGDFAGIEDAVFAGRRRRLRRRRQHQPGLALQRNSPGSNPWVAK